MTLDSEIDEIEDCMDCLLKSIKKYNTKPRDSLTPVQLKGLKHMQRRYCRYQVIHKRATGCYYLIERAMESRE